MQPTEQREADPLCECGGKLSIHVVTRDLFTETTKCSCKPDWMGGCHCKGFKAAKTEAK